MSEDENDGVINSRILERVRDIASRVASAIRLNATMRGDKLSDRELNGAIHDLAGRTDIDFSALQTDELYRDIQGVINDKREMAGSRGAGGPRPGSGGGGGGRSA